MAQNLSLGPIQVLGLDVASLNLAFAQVQEQLDAQAGLRGRALVHDRQRVSVPTASDDALTLEPTQSTVTSQGQSLAALSSRVAAVETQVETLQAQVEALEAHLAAIIAAVPAAVSVTALPTLTDAPASADALRDNLTSAWEPPLDANDAALAQVANGLRSALLAT